ncbi:hypothetical protein FRC17_004694 [Serendipita sp. 399]|nr:hypothetical protein FRC17_004694 [Serendipita sp. 399]
MDPEPNSSTVDFLNKLPTEIWQMIFSAIPSHAFLTADESTDPLVFLRTSTLDHRAMIKIQMERLELMTVCKAFYPLAEELLYKHVALSGKVLNNCSFQRAALQKASASTSGRSRGDLTTYIQVFDIIPDTSHFDLRLVCPYLRVYHDSSFATSLNLHRMKDEEWSLGVTTLAVKYPIQWHNLTILSRCFPKLTTLSLLSADFGPRVDPRLTITFRRLQNLTVDANVLKRIPFNQIKFPSLCWLCVYLHVDYDFNAIQTLLESVNHTLTGLWIHNRPLAQPLLLVSMSAPGTLDNLRTLIIHLGSDSSADVANGMAGKFPSLEHLMFMIDCRWDVLQVIERYAHYFSNATALQLKEVTLMISRFCSYSYIETGALNSVHGLFPGVPVEFQVASDVSLFSTA